MELKERIAEHDKARSAAWAEFVKVRDAALAEYDKARNAAWAEFVKARDAALAECDKVRDAAWEAIDDGTDPLVSWIIANCADYASEAIDILGLLPASLETLDAYARERAWCETWNTLRNAAGMEGLIV